MATKWLLDPTHSEITFKVKHLMISNVKGEFTTFNAEIDAEDDTFANAKVSAFVDTDSIFTNNADRDAHLKSADFFGGINSDPWGNTKAGFSFEGKIKRSDFGLTWNAALETGGVMVSEEVKIAGELQFVKQ